jgi:hypothetical protein
MGLEKVAQLGWVGAMNCVGVRCGAGLGVQNPVTSDGV